MIAYKKLKQGDGDEVQVEIRQRHADGVGFRPGAAAEHHAHSNQHQLYDFHSIIL